MANQNESTKQPKIDRRILRTRDQLLNALIPLLNVKDIKDISVTELTKSANINRGTFYLHYDDIYDMVTKIEGEIFVEFNGILGLDKEVTTPAPRAVFRDIFTFLEKYRDFLQVLMGPKGDMAFVNHLKELVEKRFMHLLAHDPSDAKAHYYVQFIVAGFVGVINSWLLSDAPSTPEVMADTCTDILKIVIPDIE